MWCCLCDPVSSRFSRTPTCDRRTDRWTDRQTDTGPWLVPRMHSIARKKLQVWLAEVDVLRHRHVDTLQLMKPALAAVTLQALLRQSPVLIRGT